MYERHHDIPVKPSTYLQVGYRIVDFLNLETIAHLFKLQEALLLGLFNYVAIQ